MHSKVILVLVGLVIFVGSGQAAVGSGKYHDPANPGKCTISGTVLSPGEKMKLPGKCVLFSCTNADGLGALSTCGVVAPPPGCTLGDNDNNAPYPDCCHREIIC